MDQQTDEVSAVGTLRRIGRSPAEIAARVAPGTDIVGITMMFLHEWPLVRATAEAVRDRHPDATIVVGGETATSLWPWMFDQTDAVDFCVLGEGEATALELVDRLTDGRPLADLPGIASRIPLEDGGSRDTGLSIRNRKLKRGPAAGVGPVPHRRVPRLRRLPRRAPRAVHADDRHPGLPLQVHVLHVAADVDHQVRGARPRRRGRRDRRLRRALRRPERQLLGPHRHHPPQVDARVLRRPRGPGPRHHLAASERHPGRGPRRRGPPAPLGHGLSQHQVRARERLCAHARDLRQEGGPRRHPRVGQPKPSASASSPA